MDNAEKIHRLFDRFERPSFKAPNRFVRSATWICGADDDTGEISAAEIQKHAEIAAGGAGTLITGLAFISPEGKSLRREWGLHNDGRISDVSRLSDEVHKYGSNLIVQICHGGGQREASVAEGNFSFSPSGGPHPTCSFDTTPLSKKDIRKIAEDFAAAALRAKKGGADGVEIHGGHGFLLTQFFSPSINKRDDEYGGPLENRSRIFYEILEEVRTSVGDNFNIWFKISIAEGTENGYGADDGIKLAASLLKRGADGINVSSGTSYAGAMNYPSILGVSAGESEAPFAEYARELKTCASENQIIILTGGLRSLPVMAELIDSGTCDLLAMSRPFIAEPDLINRWREEDSRPTACISCNACFKTAKDNKLIDCPILRDRNEGNWDPL
ncbi:MAG: NADH:flavin oxidoreductase [Synergistaceae bacterium]|nr:NADH:flavin oxidoreductase [Synergistaceae bacterium]